MKYSEFKKKAKSMSQAELAMKAKGLAADLTKSRLERTVGRSRNLRAGFNMRKQIALIKTLINKSI
jgi:ribosomal protein L29